MDRGINAQGGELSLLEGSEREDAGRAIQLRTSEEADVEALLERLEVPSGEQGGVEGAMRIEEDFQAASGRDAVDLDV